MANFNYKRFANFARYDLTINKTFYRNLSLATIFGSTGIALIGFLGRWDTYNGSNMSIEQLKELHDRGETLFISLSPFDCSGTAVCMTVFIALMSVIFTGYAFHNLRNKQGRITELTIPSTNLERWTWHALFPLLGGISLCFISVLFADVVNAILNLCVYSGDVTCSLTAKVLEDIFANDMLTQAFSENTTFGIAVALLTLSSVFISYSMYTFGNSVKYRYNIVLTYIVSQVVGFVLVIALIFISKYIDWHDTHIDAKVDLLTSLFYFLSAINITIISAFYYLSYRNYCKAQITSRWNK